MQENIDDKKYIEKRKHPRIPVRINFSCEISQVNASSVYGLLQFNSRDISSGGIFLEGIKKLPEGHVLNLDFTLPIYNKPVSVKGLVLWTSNRGSGIRFLSLDMEDVDMINEFVTEHLPKQ